MTYTAPIDDMRYAMARVAGLDKVLALPGFEEFTPDLVDAILEEAGRFAGEVLAPLNQIGDRVGSVYENGVVRTPEGFADAYRQFVEGGWNAVPLEPEHGGQGLPWLVQTAVAEMWCAANFALSLCPLLTVGACELLQAHGTPAQKATFLSRMADGGWTGTMNLTEPQAGSDLGALRSRAVPDGADAADDPLGPRYRISGQKIFISWGEHDMAENIVHLVLARTPDAPDGTRGISLFIVPKFLVGPDGTLGTHNDLRCVSIEHKLGIHASPTCVMAFGDNDGAIGYRVGEENRGLACMFTMMNAARLAVGIEGAAIAERAYQQARAYARDRVQGRATGQRDGSGDGKGVPIIRHPDVRRMLMSMRSRSEAMRALSLYTAAALDTAKRHPETEARTRAQGLVDLLTPVTKAWCTDLGVVVASTGVQVHGGMGYVEETGAAQHLRDARIAPIYEGTNGIQAQDLLARKVIGDAGRSIEALMGDVAATVRAIEDDDALTAERRALAAGLEALHGATRWVLDSYATRPQETLAGAAPYLELVGLVTGGWLMTEMARSADSDVDPGRLAAKRATARYFADHELSHAPGLAHAIQHGAGAILELAEEAL